MLYLVYEQFTKNRKKGRKHVKVSFRKKFRRHEISPKKPSKLWLKLMKSTLLKSPGNEGIFYRSILIYEAFI